MTGQSLYQMAGQLDAPRLDPLPLRQRICGGRAWQELDGRLEWRGTPHTVRPACWPPGTSVRLRRPVRLGKQMYPAGTVGTVLVADPDGRGLVSVDVAEHRTAKQVTEVLVLVDARDLLLVEEATP